MMISPVLVLAAALAAPSVSHVRESLCSPIHRVRVTALEDITRLEPEIGLALLDDLSSCERMTRWERPLVAKARARLERPRDVGSPSDVEFLFRIAEGRGHRGEHVAGAWAHRELASLGRPDLWPRIEASVRSGLSAHDTEAGGHDFVEAEVRRLKSWSLTCAKGDEGLREAMLGTDQEMTTFALARLRQLPWERARVIAGPVLVEIHSRADQLPGGLDPGAAYESRQPFVLRYGKTYEALLGLWRASTDEDPPGGLLRWLVSEHF